MDVQNKSEVIKGSVITIENERDDLEYEGIVKLLI